MIASANAWVRGPAWDAFFMLSGLWLAPLVWLFSDDVGSLYLALTVAFWIGHRVSSTYLAYCTSLYRPLLTTQRARFIWVPLGIASGVLAFLLPGDDVMPWPRAHRVLALALLDYALVTHHFAAQHYGVLSLYRLRAGQARDASAKRVDRWFALGVGGALVVLAEAIAGTVFFQDQLFGALPWAAGARIAGTALVVAATVALLAVERRALTSARALYVLSVSLVVLSAFWVSPVVFIVLWTTQHWIAAIGLATVVAARDAPGASLWSRAWARVNQRPFVVLLLLVVVSAALFPLMEVEAAGDAGRWGDDVARVVGALAASPLAPFLVALAFVTAFIHYQLDRAVFRFSDPDVRRAAGGLLDATEPKEAGAARP